MSNINNSIPLHLVLHPTDNTHPTNCYYGVIIVPMIKLLPPLTTEDIEKNIKYNKEHLVKIDNNLAVNECVAEYDF